MSQKDFNIECHPEWYFDIPHMQTLILGSFPPHENKRDYQFYYPNKQNNFWKILAAISKTDLQYYSGLEAIQERKRLMLDLNVGIQNMGKVISRKGLSARDTDIVIEEFQDILAIIKKHKELQKIIISGYSAINSTYYAFIRYLNENKIEFEEPKKVASGNSFQILVENRLVKCEIVNSTSTATRIKLSALISQFKKALRC